MDPQELQQQISDASSWVDAIREEMAGVLVGQENLVNKLLINPLSPPSAPVQGRLQGPPAKSK